jgi:preprotein translocase subunit SecG
MVTFLITIHTLVSILLVATVLMQASQGGGLSGSIGGQTTNAIFGGRGAATILSKITTWLTIAFMGLAILISLVGSAGVAATSSVVEKAAEERTLSPAQGLSIPNPAPQGLQDETQK